MVSHTEKYVDQLGAEWTITVRLTAAGARLSITTPTGLWRDLTPASQQEPRPSVDAETPLPLETQ